MTQVPPIEDYLCHCPCHNEALICTSCYAVNCETLQYERYLATHPEAELEDGF